MGPERLIEFIDTLSEAGFTASPDQLAAAHNVLVGLAAMHRLPADGRDLSRWLAPVFCETEEEQLRFYRHCEQWAPSPPPPVDTWLAGPAVARRGRRQWRAALVIGLVATAAPGAFYIRWRLRVEPLGFLARAPEGPELVLGRPTAVPKGTSFRLRVTSPDGEAVPDATLRFEGRALRTDPSGAAPIALEDDLPASFPLLVTHPAFDPVLATVVRGRPPSIIGFPRTAPSMVWSAPRRITRTRMVAPEGWRGSLFRHPVAARLAVILAVLFSLLARVIWTWRRRAELRRKASRFQPDEQAIAVRHPGATLFRDPELQRSIEALRRRQTQDIYELDLESTVLSTAANGGILRQVHRSRLAPPDHLALIERATLDDSQARVCETLLDRLEAGGVTLDRYWFADSPLRSYSSGSLHPSSLQELAESNRWSRLLLFSDGRSLLDRSGEPAAWVPLFDGWRLRVLLTPIPVADWGEPERRLAEAGFHVLPAGAEAIDLVSAIIGGKKPALPKEESGTFPPTLAREPERWLDRNPAPKPKIARLCAELREFLGAEGFQWLASCAIYPAVSWPLVVALGRGIRDARRRERILVRLVTLPWLRHGFMPNWFREALLTRLARASERSVREHLGRFLNEGGPLLPGSERLRVARGERKNAPQAAPTDHVFLQFLAGIRSDRLSFRAPERWRRLLFENGIARLGFRPAVAASGLAIVLAIAAAGAHVMVLRYGRGVAIEEVTGFAYTQYQNPPEELDPVSMRAVEVAASQIGVPGPRIGPSFISWCFAQAAQVLRRPDPMQGRQPTDFQFLTLADLRLRGLTGRGLLDDVAGEFVTNVDYVAETASEIEADNTGARRIVVPVGQGARFFTPSILSEGQTLLTMLEPELRPIATQRALAAAKIQTVLQSKIQLTPVTVALLDTGVSLPGIKSRVAPGRSFVRGEDVQDTYGHGSANAAIVLAIAPNATVVPIKVLGSDAGSGADADIVRALDYCATQSLDIVLMPLGASGPTSSSRPAYQQAFRRLLARGSVLVGVAGNDVTGGRRGPVTFPANLPEVIAVAGSSGSRLAQYSSAGPEVAIAAPSVSILTLGKLSPMTGSSPAGAVVAGVSALVKGVNPRLTPQQVRELLRRTASPIQGEAFGVVDAAAAVKAAAEYPSGAPVQQQAAVRPGPLQVRFSPDQVETSLGKIVDLSVTVDNASDLLSGPMTLNVRFDPKILRLSAVGNGNFPAAGGLQPIFSRNTWNIGAASMRFDRQPGVNGSGVLVRLQFSAAGVGSSVVELIPAVQGSPPQPMPAANVTARITVTQ